jgi:predicted ribosome quality control (RQC) complex YloA/Tae2 family protein
MKSEITSLDLHFLVTELQALVGSKVDKVYEQELDKRDFLFVFHKTGKGKLMLRVKLPSFVYMTGHKQLFPESPPGFCMFLRKYLGGSRVKDIRQKGFERILEIVFEAKTGDLTLVCELFSKGNMILLEESQKIKGLLESQNWQSRTIRGGATYEYPPSQADVLAMSEKDFGKIILETKRDSIVKTLAVDLGLGGLYAEELCVRSGLKKEDQKLDNQRISKLYAALKDMLAEPIKANRSNDELLPIGLKTIEQGQAFESFNQLLDSVLTDKIATAAEAKDAKEKKGKNDKIRLVISKQEERLAELEKNIEDNQRKGELIYEHYVEVKELLEKINQDRKKMAWEELKEKYKGNKMLVYIDEKKGVVQVELE